MASSSTSTSEDNNDNYVFDVFINHRGPDVKATLATDLSHRLCKHDLRVFLDQQELQEGENINPQIESAIRTATVHVAIFSPGYADSPWCLDELVLMVESKSKSRSTIIPVFYGVKPSELRWTRAKSGVYGRSLCVLEGKKTFDGRPRHDPNTIEKWRNALSEAADIKGLDYETYNSVKTGILQCLEAAFELCNLCPVFRAEQLLEDAVEAVLKNVKKTLHVAEYPKGLEEKLQDFKTTVSLQRESGKIGVIGILGLGGVGKTTLAKEFFNRERLNYKRSCFLFDIRENSLTSLQSDLLKDLNQKNEQIRSIDEGKEKLKKYLKSSHALIILDNVDRIQQLEALLLPEKDVLQPGSLIVVTSRNKDVLTSSNIPMSSIYRLTCLNQQHSKELFCSYAFGQSHSVVGFDEVVKKFLDACHGLPLSLKVLGALLRGNKNLNHWKAQLRKISKTLPEDIQSILKISYDGLDKEEKQMFLDIACFFTGEDRDTVIRIGDGFGWEGSLCLLRLENRCLVEVDSNNCIRMHDHLRDMGRDLAEEKPVCELRLWRQTDNLPHAHSTQTPVRGINNVHQNDSEQFSENLPEFSGNMSTLRLLRSESYFVKSLLSIGQLPQLIYLRWEKCPESSLPPSIPIKNLRVLYVGGGKLKSLWQSESQAPLKLRELYIRGPLTEVPQSIGKLKELEKIVLYKSHLETLPNEFGHMYSLNHVALKYCTKIKLLPDSVGNLARLQILDLCNCSMLRTLPESVGNLTGLQSLDLSLCSSLERLPNSIGNLTDLQSLNLRRCSSLKTLPDSFGKLTSLRSLNLVRCSDLLRLPDSVGNLTGLRSLELSGCHDLQSLPDSIGNLTGLQNLGLGSCRSLQRLPDSVGNLTGLRSLELGGCRTLQTLPDSVGNLTGLRSLVVGEFRALQTLPDSVGKLTGLESLELGGCRALQMLPDSVGNLTSLRSLVLGECRALRTLSDSVGKLTGLQNLDLEGCRALQMLPDSVGNLTGLQILQLRRCSHLQVVPKFEHLRSLVKLDVSGCPKLQWNVGVIEQLRQRLGEGFSAENLGESFSEESE